MVVPGFGFGSSVTFGVSTVGKSVVVVPAFDSSLTSGTTSLSFTSSTTTVTCGSTLTCDSCFPSVLVDFLVESLVGASVTASTIGNGSF